MHKHTNKKNDESKVLEKMLEKYASLDNAELEIRPKKPTREQFTLVYENLRKLKDAKFDGISQTLNIISKNLDESQGNRGSRANSIMQITYRGTKAKPVRVKEEYIKKTSVLFPLVVRGYVPYTINLNTEEKIDKFNMARDAFVRFKNRISYIHDQWRFDLTIIKETTLADCGSLLKKMVSEIFTELTQDNFLSAINNMHTNKLEVEIEHLPSDDNKNNLKPADVDEIVDLLFRMINNNYSTSINSQSIIQKCAKLMIEDERELARFNKRKGLKQLLNQVKTVDKVTHKLIYPMKGYMITEKADGLRTLVYYEKANSGLSPVYLINKDLSEYEVKLDLTRFMCEGELITDEKDPSKKTLLIFDVMYFNDEKVYEMPMKLRINFISKIIGELNKVIDKFSSGEGDVKFVEKTFVTIPPTDIEPKELHGYLKKKYGAKYDYEIDGLIFSEPDADYRSTNSYKWKPPAYNSIDFLAIKVPANILGVKPYLPKPGKTLYLLFSAIHINIKRKLGLSFIEFYDTVFPEYKSKKEDYIPIQFCPSANPLEYMFYYDTDAEDLNYKVVELTKTISKDDQDKYRQYNLGEWNLLRIRDDRSFERAEDYNNYEVAEKIYMNFLNPIFFEDLSEFPSSYFSFEAPTMYKAKNYYNRTIYGEIIYNNANESEYLIDLGTGRGGDIMRYNQAGIKAGIFLDDDIDALTELIQRKYNMIKRTKFETKVSKFRRERVSDLGIKILIMHANLKDDHASLLKKINDLGYAKHSKNVCTSNFALHYLCDTEANIKNIVELVDSLLIKGGLFVFTVMDGKAIFDLLSDLDEGQKWVAMENGVEKYGIKKLYSGAKIEPSGQTISVRMPFTNEYYEEPLCNVEYIIKLFTAKKYAVEMNSNFLDKINSPEVLSAKAGGRLTANDKHYIGLQRYVSLRKMT